MKKRVLSCCFFLSTIIAFSQGTFPGSFIGHWKGTLEWFQQGKTLPQKVKMQLVIQPADSANTYTWQIVYGDKGEDNRPYILRPVDTAKDHWQIDERNGIILDQYFIANRFTSAFTVQTTTIVNSYWREGEKLIIEFYGLTAKPVSTSGEGTDNSPKVDSYGIKSYQRAVMKRNK